MAEAEDVRCSIETFKIKMEQYNSFISPKCEEELLKIFDNKEEANNYFDRMLKYYPYFLENPTIFFNKGTIFERLTLSKKNKKSNGNLELCCYKHIKNGKNKKNIRCIFVIEGNNKFFILAFIETRTKDYEKAIDSAIKRYNEMNGGSI